MKGHAFTLVELLVVLSIITLLLALSLPSLSSAKQKSNNIQSLSVLRQLMTATTMYCDDNRDYYPYFGTPGDPTGSLMIQGFDLRSKHQEYFSAHSQFWTSLLYPHYFTSTNDLISDEVHRDKYIKHGYPDFIIPSIYLFTHTTQAAPPYWRGDDPPEDLGLYRGMRQDQIRFPSNKGIILDGRFVVGPNAQRGSHNPDYESGIGALEGIADGSARLLNNWLGYFDREHVPGVRPYGALPWSPLSTTDGIYGRDFN